MEFTKKLSEAEIEGLTKKQAAEYELWLEKNKSKRIVVEDKTGGKGAEVRILKEGVYEVDSVKIILDVTKPKVGKQVVKIATIEGVCNGKPFSFRTINMDLVDSVVSYSESNDTDKITFNATKEEGDRYLNWTLVL